MDPGHKVRFFYAYEKKKIKWSKNYDNKLNIISHTFPRGQYVVEQNQHSIRDVLTKVTESAEQHESSALLLSSTDSKSYL